VGLLDSTDIDKNFSFLLLTLCDISGADTFSDLVISDQVFMTCLVYPCQLSLDDISNHPLS